MHLWDVEPVGNVEESGEGGGSTGHGHERFVLQRGRRSVDGSWQQLDLRKSVRAAGEPACSEIKQSVPTGQAGAGSSCWLGGSHGPVASLVPT